MVRAPLTPMPIKRVEAGEPKKRGGGLYFASDNPNIQFISTGSALLDCVLGGGYAVGRVANIVGDKSVGKTLLAIEACANFARAYPKGRIVYAESEAAFDQEYAATIGLPIERIRWQRDLQTVEDWITDVLKRLDKANGQPILYVLDSLDALSDVKEMEREMGEGSYGTQKAKLLSEFFRKHIHRIAEAKMTLLIISQVRDNIGVTFGRSYKRSGGRALDFYATHVLYLAYLNALTKTVHNHKRAVGVNIKAKCEKNKIDMPMRTCEFTLLFGYGIDDVGTNLRFLKEAGALKEVGLQGESVTKALANIGALPDAAMYKRVEEIAAATRKVWRGIEIEFRPKRRKYGNEAGRG